MKHPVPSYRLDPETSSFVIENYNWAESFSNFFPGIAGKWGIPLWIYYVNRAQAVCSMGVRDKNGQILEFYSFNKAIMRVAREGFRTFLKIDGGACYEPFQKTERPGIRQTMIISSAELVLRERNRPLGIEIEVAYFPLPNLPIAALGRRVRLRNLSSRARRVEWIDGAPRVLPFGLDQARIKTVSRHIEGMIGVDVYRGIPLFRLKQTPDDSEKVGKITDGHFFAVPGLALGKGIVIDAAPVFGETLNFDRPWTFEAGGARAVLASPQMRENKTPAAFAVRTDDLPPLGGIEQISLLGHVHRDENLDPLLTALKRKDFLKRKRGENTRIVEEVADRCFTASSSPHFDAYSRQDFLDNVIRGGMPLMFDTEDRRSAFYLYSRQNGGLERDYHHFVIDPTFLSQGNGHYRSVLQNRRTDAWFFPESEDANILIFQNLIQLDGYNPLEVRGLSFRVSDEKGLKRWLRANVRSEAVREAVLDMTRESFTPGELLMTLESGSDVVKRARLAARGRKPLPSGFEVIRGHATRRDAQREKIVRELLSFCRENELGGLHEGFWVDHWHYNFDLLETYLMVYPDRLKELLLGRRNYTFFDDPDVILPRSEKSVDAGGRIRCYGAVVRDAEKERRIAARKSDPYTVRTRKGKGKVYRTNLLPKLLCVVANRLATLDPAGTGIEMEAGKPGWNDSMNGLPGLFGSGLSETLELRRAVGFLLDWLGRMALPRGRRIPVYEELAWLMRTLLPAIRRRNASKSDRAAFRYWDESNTAKERYRAKTKFGVAGREARLTAGFLRDFLKEGKLLLDGIFKGASRRKVLSKGGVPYTYFVNRVVRHKPTGRKSRLGYPLVRALDFKQRPVRLFLEGPVHWMKDRPNEAKAVYDAVRRSKVYDRKLKMYKSCEDMRGEDHELGRAVGAYPRGWIENESVYLHMEYKYLLEIIRSGLCSEFWRDAKTALVPFMDPAVYRRSVLEGASFLVSSAYPDARLHGRAFQPRLSGLTCEFLHLWTIAVGGERPFRADEDGRLALALEPRLPGWMFTRQPSIRRYHDDTDGWTEVSLPKNTFAFKLMGRALVVYHNKTKKDTYGPRAVRPAAHRLEFRDGRVVECGATVPGAAAEAVRDGRVRRIDIRLA